MAVFKNGRIQQESVPYFGDIGRQVSMAENAQELFNVYPTGRRNLIDNGAFQVNQKFEEYTGVTEYGVNGVGDEWKEGPDRWHLEFNASTWQLTVRRGTTDPAPGFKYYYEVEQEVDFNDPDSGLGYYVWVIHKLEGYDCNALQYGTRFAQPSVIQFWVRSAHPGQYALNIYAAGDPSSTRIWTGQYTIGQANTWEKKTLRVPPNTETFCEGRTNSTAIWLQWGVSNDSTRSQGQSFNFWDTFSADNYMVGGRSHALANPGDKFAITGVQWEIGNTATPYEHKSFQEELTKAQRYLYRVNSIGGASRVALSGNYSSTNTYSTIQLPVAMRTIPSLTYSSLNALYFEQLTGTQQNLTGISLNTRAQSDSDMIHNVTLLGTVTNTPTAGGNILLRGTNGVDFFELTAEL